MKKISTFISLVCILNIVAIVGILGYLLGTGRLNKSKAQVITDILRTQGAPEDFRKKVSEVMKPEPAAPLAASSAPATGPALVKEDIPATAAERNEYVRKAVETERLRLENEAQDLRNRQEMLAHTQAQLDANIKAVEAEKKTLESKAADAAKQTDDGKFQKMMALFEELKPKQIKDLLITMPTDEAGRYMAAMDTELAAKIIGEFKTTEEKATLKTLMDRLRGAGTASGTGAASTSGTALTAAGNPDVKAGP